MHGVILECVGQLGQLQTVLRNVLDNGLIQMFLRIEMRAGLDTW